MLPLQTIALIFTIASVYLSAKRNISTWSVGIIGITAFFLLFLTEKLYFQAGLQVIFFLQSLYGWYLWNKNKKTNEFVVKKVENGRLIFNMLVVLLITLPIGYYMGLQSNNPQPYLDAVSTGMALLATYYLSKSYIQAWLIWMIVNMLIFVIALKQGMYIISYLELILFILSIYGYINWTINSKDGKSV